MPADRVPVSWPSRTALLRLLATGLVALWAALGAGILAVRPASAPFDLLTGAAALVPALLALVAVVRPPTPSRGWLASGVVWLHLAAGLLLSALLLAVAHILEARPERRLLEPSGELALGVVLALLCTGAIAGLALTSTGSGPGDRPGDRPRGDGRWRRSAASLAITVAATATGSLALAPAARVGAGEPVPECGAARIAAGGRMVVEASAELDGSGAGSARLEGVRSGTDERWTMTVATRWQTGSAEYVRLGSDRWLRRDGGDWTPTTVEPVAGPLPSGAPAAVEPNIAGVDGAVLSLLLGPTGRPVPEDRGIELVAGDVARHCRTLVDGPSVLAAVPPLRWIAHRDPFDPRDVPPGRGGIRSWRGELDWWVSPDGRIGLASVLVTGFPVDVWPASGLAATFRATLRVTEPDVPHPIEAPTASSGRSRASTGRGSPG